MTVKEHSMIEVEPGTKVVRVFYPTRMAMLHRLVGPFSANRTIAEVKDPNKFKMVAEYLQSIEVDDELICEQCFYHTNNCPAGEFTGSLLQRGIKAATGLGRTAGPLHASHTSMSVGDVVQIGDKFYVCDSFGFAALPSE